MNFKDIAQNSVTLGELFNVIGQLNAMIYFPNVIRSTIPRRLTNVRSDECSYKFIKRVYFLIKYISILLVIQCHCRV